MGLSNRQLASRHFVGFFGSPIFTMTAITTVCFLHRKCLVSANHYSWTEGELKSEAVDFFHKRDDRSGEARVGISILMHLEKTST